MMYTKTHNYKVCAAKEDDGYLQIDACTTVNWCPHILIFIIFCSMHRYWFTHSSLRLKLIALVLFLNFNVIVDCKTSGQTGEPA